MIRNGMSSPNAVERKTKQQKNRSGSNFNALSICFVRFWVEFLFYKPYQIKFFINIRFLWFVVKLICIVSLTFNFFTWLQYLYLKARYSKKFEINNLVRIAILRGWYRFYSSSLNICLLMGTQVNDVSIWINKCLEDNEFELSRKNIVTRKCFRI